MGWEQIGLIVGVLSPLVGVPLMVITVYLRAIRDHQTQTESEIGRRIETMEVAVRDLLRCTANFEREYATKEEWVRESMLARQRLEKLTEMVTRIEVELESGHGVAMEISRATAALMDLLNRLAGAERAADEGGAGPAGAE